MKTFTDFALKKEWKSLQSVGDKFFEIDSLIDWKSFRIILESICVSQNILLRPT